MRDEVARFHQPSLLQELDDEPEPDPLARPRRRERAAARDWTPFERELLEAPCPRHTLLAVCDDCTPLRGRDSTGFPSAQHAMGRGRYRVCSSCGKLQQIVEWSFVARSCHRCAGTEQEGETAAPIAKPAPPSPRVENHPPGKSSLSRSAARNGSKRSPRVW